VCSNCHQLATSGAMPAAKVVAANAGAAPGPKEGEWLGLEVGASAQGVVVHGVEGLSARRGVLANDLVSSINGIAIASMSDFVRVTQNGALAQGTLIVSRAGQRFAFELAPSTPPVPLAQPPAYGLAPPFPQPPAAQEAQF
jgi:S1-C subfamily serine protease